MDLLTFKTRAEFRAWLGENSLSGEGVWLAFDKRKPSGTLTAGEALEEALCFGWIDSQIRSVDENSYVKYFKRRADGSAWSEKNKKLAAELEAKGLMTDFGRAKIGYAKQNGGWDTQARETLTDENIREFERMLEPFEAARANFLKMPPSARKAYMGSYFFGAKTEDGKRKRFETIAERLEMGLNPMESMKKKENRV